MSVVRSRLRAELRTRWVAWTVIAIIAGIGAGIVSGLAAGARRTERAYPAFAEAHAAADVVVAGQSQFGLIGSVKLDDVEKLPVVDDTTRATATLLFTGETSDGRRVGPVDLFPVASESERLGRDIERWDMVEGRRANPHRVTEATASFVLADELGLEVGDTVRLRFVKAESFARVAVTLLGEFGKRLTGARNPNAETIDTLADGPDVTFRVVGIEASPAEFPPLGIDLSPVLHLTPAFEHKYRGKLAATSAISYVRLDDPSFRPAFEREVERLAPGEPTGFIGRRDEQTTKVQRSVHVQAIALWMVAALVLVGLVFVVAQALLREMLALSHEDGILTALGVTRRGLVQLGLARGAAMGVLASLIAVAVAIAISPLMPIGIARRAELHPGVSFDGRVLAACAIGVVLTVTLLAAFAAWRTSARRQMSPRPTMRITLPLIDHALDRVPLPRSADIGVRFALDRGGSIGGVPILTTVLGATLALVLLGGVWSFQASLDRLLGTPSLYGWNWDAKLGAPALPDIGPVLVPALLDDPDLGRVASGTLANARIGGHRIDVLALDQDRGVVAPTLLEGRAPRNAREIVLGTKTLENTDAEVGSLVNLGIGDQALAYVVSGRAVFPSLGDNTQLGEGGFVTYRGLQRLLPNAQANTFFVWFAEGVDESAAQARTVKGMDPVPTRFSGRPRDLENIAEVNSLPQVLAALLVALAATTLAHTLVSSVRRRRRDLAVLKAMGFRRGQVSLTVVWQTTTLVTMALVVGIPIGVFLGVAAWDVFAEELGTEAGATIPVVLVAATVPIALLFGNAIAAIPAWFAGRTRAAVALREE